MESKKSSVLNGLKTVALILFFLLVAFGFLTVCSQNSFLYKFNTNTDVNWYITVGRGIVNGKAPYRDLFEQKGPLLYVVFSFFCLFKNPYIMVLLFEVVCLGVFAYLTFKLARRYVSPFASVICAITILFVAVSSPYNLAGGGAVEEFFLPLIMYVLLCFIEFIEEKKQFSPLRSMLIGASVAAIFWVKFTAIVGLVAMLLIWLIISIKNKDFKKMFASIGFMILGFAIITFLSVLYYIINHALKDMFWAYFYINLFAYNSKYMGVLVNVFKLFAYDYVCCSIMFVGMFLYFKETGKKAWLYFLVLFINLGILMLQNCHIYYFVVLYPFASLGLIMIFKQFCHIKYNAFFKVVSAMLCLVVGLGYCYFLCPSTRAIKNEKSDYIQLVVADDISNYSKQNGIENPTLFCYKMYDYGFYNACKITPNARFFAQNVFKEDAFPEMFASFDKEVEKQSADFLLCEKGDYIKNEALISKYYSVVHEYEMNQFSNLYIDKIDTFVLLIKA